MKYKIEIEIDIDDSPETYPDFTPPESIEEFIINGALTFITKEGREKVGTIIRLEKRS
jgi:hypothetical protein